MKVSIALFLCGGLVLAATAAAADFPAPYNSEPDVNGHALPPAEAAAGFRLPAGFRVQVFAAEPELQNPIGMTWDSRGRLWVAENYTYAEAPRKFDLGLRDRIVILEDRDGDGRAEGRKVFTDEAQMLTSVEVGLAGVWMMCPPQLLFVPDADGDDIPDGPAQVVLDGFTIPAESYHNFANGLRWGPDGWLYGRCGASAPGRIGAPGTADVARIPLGGGLWRFHPRRKTFEVLAHGTTNPWGHDWNEFGEPFFINTVNGHLWHSFPGAHFRRPHTQDPNPRVYMPIEMHADHWHWDIGKDWADSRSGKGKHDELGGGHAHSGCMIYLADNWPKQYVGCLMTCNFHGRRINVERLEREGSGYVARHAPDIFQSADPWFRGIDLSYGPDGGVFVLDWSDTGECHERNGVHRTSGRVYKVTYGKPVPKPEVDLSKLDVATLVQLQRHPNEWYARQSRRVLADHVAAGRGDADAKRELRNLYAAVQDPVHKVRILWTLSAIGGADPAFLRGLLTDEDEHIRVCAIRLLTDDWPLDTIDSTRPAASNVEEKRVARAGPMGSPGLPPDVDLIDLAAFVKLATSDPSALVRLYLASTLQRLPPARRVDLAAALGGRAEDSKDHNLPDMLWYGLIPVAETDPAALVKLAASVKIPVVRKYIARRLAEDLEKSPDNVDKLVELATAGSPEFQLNVLDGLTEGLAGWRKAPQPAAWGGLQMALAKTTSPELQSRLRELSVLFGDGRALDEVKKIALDNKAEMSARRAALETLIASRPDDLRKICESLLSVRFLNTTAVRGLARFDDPAIGDKLAKSYRNFHQSERGAVVETLVSRPAFAKALLRQMAEGKIPRTDLSPFQARQIRSFNDPALSELLSATWGELRDSAADKRQVIAAVKARLSSEVLAKADKQNGRLVYATACATCHRLYGYGGAVGPDLTGAGRHNLDYLLENIIDPSAMVSAAFRMSVVALDDGRVLNGIVAAQTERTITLQTAKEQITLSRSEIDEQKPSALSIMPEGLLQPLSESQIRDLIAYLMHPTQVSLPPGATVPPTDVKPDAVHTAP